VGSQRLTISAMARPKSPINPITNPNPVYSHSIRLTILLFMLLSLKVAITININTFILPVEVVRLGRWDGVLA
jgi:hypothetical protein